MNRMDDVLVASVHKLWTNRQFAAVAEVLACYATVHVQLSLPVKVLKAVRTIDMDAGNIFFASPTQIKTATEPQPARPVTICSRPAFSLDLMPTRSRLLSVVHAFRITLDRMLYNMLKSSVVPITVASPKEQLQEIQSYESVSDRLVQHLMIGSAVDAEVLRPLYSSLLIDESHGDVAGNLIMQPDEMIALIPSGHDSLGQIAVESIASESYPGNERKAVEFTVIAGRPYVEYSFLTRVAMCISDKHAVLPIELDPSLGVIE